MMTSSPMVTLPIILAPALMLTLLPMVGEVAPITITDSYLLINPTILTNVSARNNGRKAMLDKEPAFDISTIDIKIEGVE